MAQTSSAAPLQLLRQFQAVQAERARQYTRFHDGFRNYLANRNEAAYQALLAQLTPAFNACSQQVLAISEALTSRGRDDLAELLRGVQVGERDKLRLTLAVQALRQATAPQAGAVQHAAHAGGCSCCSHGRDDDDDGLSGPPEAAYQAALPDALRALDEAVIAINELLGQIAEEVEAMEEEGQEQGHGEEGR